MPITQGIETNCKKSDEAIVVMKHMKVCGAKGRITIALSDGKFYKILEVICDTGGHILHSNRTPEISSGRT